MANNLDILRQRALAQQQQKPVADPFAEQRARFGDLVVGQAQQQPQQKKGNFLTHLLPTIGGTGGGVAGGAAGGALAGSLILPGIGTAAGGLLGALLGGAAGGAAGKVAENKIEGQGAFNGVGGQALEQGVLSAGPIRLIKGVAGATKAATAGQGLTGALNAAGARAASPSMIKTALANRLDSSAENVAQRGLKMNDSKFNTDFANKAGEEVGSFARRFKIPQNGIDHASENIYKPGQQAYADAVGAIGTIPKSQVITTIQDRVASKLASAVPDDKAFAKSVMKEAKGVLDNLPEEISATELNAVKSRLSGLVKNGVTDSKGLTKNAVLQTVGDAFRNTINTAAKTNGVKLDEASLKQMGFKSKTVGELGNELNHLKTFLEKADVKSRVGSGSNPIDLTSAAVAGGVGGPAGLAGAATVHAINSSGGRRSLMKGVDRLASRADQSAVKSASPYTAGSVAKRTVPVGLLGALGQSNSTQPTTQTTMNDPTNSIIDSQYADQTANAIDQSTSDSPFDPANIDSNVQKILAQGGKFKDVSEYLSLVEQAQKLSGGGKQKALNSTQLQQANNAQSGLESLATIQSSLQKNGNIGKLAALPGGSLTSSLTGAGTYKAALANATDVIGRLRSGGAINADEEKRFRSLLPQSFDDQQTINYKLTALGDLFNRFVNPQASSTDVNDLVSALGQ